MRWIILNQPVWIDGVLISPEGGAIELSDDEAHAQICSGGGRDVTDTMVAAFGDKPRKSKAPATAAAASQEQ